MLLALTSHQLVSMLLGNFAAGAGSKIAVFMLQI